MKPPVTPKRPTPATRQLSLAFNPVNVPALGPAERATAVRQLAVLLMEAAGVPTGEHADDER